MRRDCPSTYEQFVCTVVLVVLNVWYPSLCYAVLRHQNANNDSLGLCFGLNFFPPKKNDPRGPCVCATFVAHVVVVNALFALSPSSKKNGAGWCTVQYVWCALTRGCARFGLAPPRVRQQLLRAFWLSASVFVSGEMHTVLYYELNS